MISDEFVSEFNVVDVGDGVTGIIVVVVALHLLDLNKLN